MTKASRVLALLLAELTDILARMSETFAASRWTRGNFFFPTRIEVSPERVLRVKPRWFGSTEESIPMSKVASVQIAKGLFFAEIRIDSTGGTNPILSHGHRRKDAERIRALIEQHQQGGRTPFQATSAA